MKKGVVLVLVLSVLLLSTSFVSAFSFSEFFNNLFHRAPDAVTVTGDVISAVNPNLDCAIQTLNLTSSGSVVNSPVTVSFKAPYVTFTLTTKSTRPPYTATKSFTYNYVSNPTYTITDPSGKIIVSSKPLISLVSSTSLSTKPVALVPQSFVFTPTTIGLYTINVSGYANCGGSSRQAYNIKGMQTLKVNVVSSVCTDSDGEDAYTKGAVTAGKDSAVDICKVKPVPTASNPNPAPSSVNSCSAGSSCYVNEMICAKGTNGIAYAGGKDIQCKNGCNNGACVGPVAPACQSVPSSSSDKIILNRSAGQKYFDGSFINQVTGNLETIHLQYMSIGSDSTTNTTTFKDLATGKTYDIDVRNAILIKDLNVYLGYANKATSVIVVFVSNTQGCLGLTVLGNNGSYYDSIVGSNCTKYSCGFKPTTCPSTLSCSPGSISSLTNGTYYYPDAGLTCPKLTCIIAKCPSAPVCSTGYTLISNGPDYNSTVDGYCNQWSCVANTCKDSDGGLNYALKGSATKPGAGSTYDFCVNSTKLSEAICNNGGLPANAQYDCPNNGCSNGACNSVSNTTSTTTTPPAICKDGDSGSFSVKGTLTLGSNSYTDYCISASTIVEYNCVPEDLSKYSIVSSICPKGCSAGRCL